MRIYSVYGLRLKSEWPLPCAEEASSGLAEFELFESEPFFFAQAAREARKHSSTGQWHQFIQLPDGSEYLRWSGLFEFLVSADGRRIAGRPLNSSFGESFHTYLLGQVLSHALLKSGIEHLHSTAIVLNGVAIGLMGDSGYGKSSLASAFVHDGYPLLTDDILVLTQHRNRFYAYPGFPRLKLFPDIAKSVFGPSAKGTPMNNQTHKLIIPLTNDQFCQAPVPLGAIYVLTQPGPRMKGNKVMIRQMPRRQAFLQLIKNTYNRDVVRATRLNCQFLLSTSLASIIPIKFISFSRDVVSLPAVRQAILSDLSQYTPADRFLPANEARISSS